MGKNLESFKKSLMSKNISQIESKQNDMSDSFFVSKNIIYIVDRIISNGIKNCASDIHISNFENNLQITYRIDGVIEKLNGNFHDNSLSGLEIISRIKILSDMNVAEKRLPQDGNIKFKFENLEYDIRVATMPSITGETIVLRILKNYLSDTNLETLGFSKENSEKLKKYVKSKNGLILITGPTGSGKSTTLLSLINLINRGDKKIISIEDPVENRVKGIVQVQINENIGLTFPKVLRSTLRNDPDVIIVSEIRDEITAEITVRAALTGHLVLATLHTNDAITTISRLVDMKIPKYLIMDSLLCIVSQRLVNVKEYLIDKDPYILKQNFKLKDSRININEVLEMTKNVKNIFNEFSSKDIILEELKKEDFKTMDDDLVSKF